MDLLQAIRGRRAIRDYADKALTESAIRSLIDEAVWAPSGVNLQPWCFFVVDNPAALAAYSAEAKSLMLRQADKHLELPQLREMLASSEFNIFYNAPVLVVICATTPDEMALKDCCLAAQTLMLAAHAQGLGSCWIGFAEAWLNSPAGKAKLGIPAEYRPVAPIILGYPKGPVAAAERRMPDIRHVNAREGLDVKL
jgi:nitroreductase